MPCMTDKLTTKGLINPPAFMKHNVHYEVIMGSYAYGVSTDVSDVDVYGFCIPNKDIIFPHLTGYIDGFDEQQNKFNQFQKHHVIDADAGKEYDLTIYNIVKFIKLCMDNNPNMVDSLFVPQHCVLHCSHIGGMVREKRDLFLHKGSWHKFKGYAYSQLQKIRTKHSHVKMIYKLEQEYNIQNPCNSSDPYEAIHSVEHANDTTILKDFYNMRVYDAWSYFKSLKKLEESPNQKRRADVRKYGYDVKFAYHVVRLLNEVEQIMTEHTLDLQRNREQLKSIRRGEWTFEELLSYFEEKERSLEKVYNESTLRYSPDRELIKELLINCLEEHFGDLSAVVIKSGKTTDALIREIEEVIRGYRI